MYLREALRWCRDLEEEAGHIYEELAAQHGHDAELSRHWQVLAADERKHARIMAAALAAEDVHEDDGPFVVDVRPRLDRLKRILDRAYKQVRTGTSAAAAAELTAFIEGTELDDVFAELVELSRPSVLRLLGVIEKDAAGVADPHRSHVAALLRTAAERRSDAAQQSARRA